MRAHNNGRSALGELIVRGCYITVSRLVPRGGYDSSRLIFDSVGLTGIHHTLKAAFAALGGCVCKLLDLFAG